ncbi:hypothetical protein [uncultured phage MedDCM-OCT-S01-C29]|nr:hypothetical protein [uncultured phage MedDCM-OCT-S01-C29]
MNGSATFASQVSTTDRFDSNRTTGTDNVFNGRLNNSLTSSILANGSAYFASNVGIGESNPAYLLDVKFQTSRTFQLRYARPYARYDDNAMIDALTLENTGTTASGHGSKIKFIVGTSSSSNTSHIAAGRDGAAGNTNLTFGTNAFEGMRLDSQGGLYIGPSNDYSTANYAQASGNGNFYYRRDNGSQAGTIIASNNADRGWSLAYLNKFSWNTGDDARFINFYLNGAGQDSITWTGSAINYGTSSDYRRKTNPSTYTGAFEKVKQLHVREYNWIEFPEAGRTVGFFAHELQEIFPQAVTGVKDGMKIDEFTGEEVPDYQGIDYGKITPLLAAALQEAIAKIETLEQRLSDAGIA